MIIEISKKLEERLIDSCHDELNYHIHESGCADEYHAENLAEIEMLYRLGLRRHARRLKTEYHRKLKEMIRNGRGIADLPALKRDLGEFWHGLKESVA